METTKDSGCDHVAQDGRTSYTALRFDKAALGPAATIPPHPLVLHPTTSLPLIHLVRSRTSSHARQRVFLLRRVQPSTAWLPALPVPRDCGGPSPLSAPFRHQMITFFTYLPLPRATSPTRLLPLLLSCLPLLLYPPRPAPSPPRP